MYLEQERLHSKLLEHEPRCRWVDFAYSTLEHLRKIRGAFDEGAVLAKTAADDAHRLGTASSAYLIDSITGKEDVPLKQMLIETLEDIAGSYAAFKMVTYAPDTTKRSRKEQCNDIFKGYSEYLKGNRYFATIDGEFMMGLGMSELFTREFKDSDLFDERLGVLAPLSFDYLMAALFQRFFQIRTDKPAFKIRPLVLKSTLESNPSPDNIGSQYDPEFDHAITRILIVTDIDVNGLTRQAALKTVSFLYPNKRIYGLDR